MSDHSCSLDVLLIVRSTIASQDIYFAIINKYFATALDTFWSVINKSCKQYRSQHSTPVGYHSICQPLLTSPFPPLPFGFFLTKSAQSSCTHHLLYQKRQVYLSVFNGEQYWMLNKVYNINRITIINYWGSFSLCQGFFPAGFQKQAGFHLVSTEVSLLMDFFFFFFFCPTMQWPQSLKAQT